MDEGRERWLLRGVLLLSLAGLGLSAFLTANHYRLASAGFCSLGGWLDCEFVNRSEYSEILGVPVALVGILGFAATFGLAYVRLVSDRLSSRQTADALLALSGGGVAFGVYLTLIEVFVLHAICILCASAFAAMTAMLGIGLVYRFGHGSGDAAA